MTRSLFKSLPSLFTMTDEQAMWRVKLEDDPQAFAQLVRRWEKPIQALCLRMVGDPQGAEDLAQEAFARVFGRRKEYESSGRFSTFLWRVALNLCYDELRRLKRRRELFLADAPAGEAEEGPASGCPAPDLCLVEQERAETIRLALLRLDEAYRSVVVLRHFEGLKFREIAEVLEIPEGTVKSRMAEALDQLNRILRHSFNESESHEYQPAKSIRPV